MAEDQQRETVYEALSRLRTQNSAEIDLAQGRIIGPPESVVQMARMLDNLCRILATMEEDIETLRAQVERHSEGHG
jgi:hypothetical protein